MSTTLIGQTLAHYRITAAIGAGGMGEVYRATDTRLGRDVALKLLPEGFASDPERLARFEREARLLAALSHTNIAHLYGFETASTPEGKEAYLIVMELAEGEDLAERLKHGPVPLDDALELTRQIAEALEAAHEKGIVHRDLKPANVKVAPDGKLKVLDFGLAKAWSDESASLISGSTPALSQSPTLARSGTAAGIIIGTAAYMSPEQARGKPVDKRADIWAFGVVVFEMLTGRKLFDGETVTDVLAAVVRQDVDWSLLPRSLPAGVASMLKRCLDRDPRTRLRDIGEARIALAGRSEATSSASDADGKPVLTRRGFAVASALTGAGALLGFGLGRWSGRSGMASPGGVSLEVTRVTSSGDVIAAATSPDGRYVAYVESDQGLQSLWLRQLATGQTLRLIADDRVFYWGHAFSPDGNSVVFGLKTPDDTVGGLFTISTLGGTVRRLVTAIDSPPTFSPDGTRMAYVRARFPSAEESALMVAGADGSQPKPLHVFKLPEYVAEIFFTGPAWSPDGSRIATAVARLGSTTSDARARLVTVAVADGSVSVLSDPGWLVAAQAGYLPDGRGLLVVARAPHQPNTQIWHVTSPGGLASPVTNDLNDHRVISLSKDGRSLVTVAGDVSSTIWVGPRDGGAPPRRRTSTKLDGYGGIAVAPDGRLVYTTTDGAAWSLWTMTLDGSQRAPLLTTPPGERIDTVAVSGAGDVFLSVRTQAGIEVRVVASDGTSKGTVVREISDGSIGVSRDASVVYTALVGGAPRLFILDAKGGKARQVTDRVAFVPAIDPSGRRIAFYYLDEAGRFHLGIVSPEGGEPSWSTLSEPPSSQSRLGLREDGLFVNTMPGDRANVWQLPLDGSKPRKVTSFDDQIVFDFAFTDDGRTLAVARGPRVRDALLMKGFTGSPSAPSA
jgi:Tol biopolymer transport system component